MKNLAIDKLLDQLNKAGFLLRKNGNKINCISIKNVSLSSELYSAIIKHRNSLLAHLENQAIPLSPMQNGIWFISKHTTSLSTYNVSIALTLNGNLNSVTLQTSINLLIKRHEILRTIFPNKNGIPQQVILPEFNISLESSQSLTETAQKPFDLETKPAIRCKLFKKSELEHSLLFGFHHIIIDGWSLGIFFQELSEIYNALIRNNTPSLKPIKIQYADYILWQSQWFKTITYKQHLNFWRRYLAAHEDTDFPTDFKRPKTQRFCGKTFNIKIPNIIKERLAKLSETTSSSMFMLLLTITNLLLHRYSGQNTITVGIPCANRNHPSIENTLGFFTNTLPIKNIFPTKSTFLEFIKIVKHNCLNIYKHQTMPFEHLVKKTTIINKPGKNPIFQIMFNLIDTELRPKLNLIGLQNSTLKLQTNTAKFDLSFNFILNPDNQLECNLEYNTSLYKATTINRIGKYLLNLLNKVTTKPNIKISDITILTTKEENQLLVAWNTAAKLDNSIKTKQPIHKLFEQQAEKYPLQTAISYENTTITYSELNHRANLLATTIVQKCNIETLIAKCNNIVAILLHKNLKAIISLLAILKAGMIYLPLTLNHPDKRLKFIINDAKPKIIITENQLLQRLSSLISLPSESNSINIDKIDFKTKGSTTSLQQLCSNANDSAYVIYTSGSTGTPKASILPHITINNLITWQNQETTPHIQKVAQFADLSFDVSMQEIFFALLNGYELCLIPEKTKLSLSKLLHFITKEKITVLFIPTIILNLFAATALTENIFPEELTTIIVAGETLQITTIIKNFFAKAPHLQLINQYGPSETHVVTSYKMPTETKQWQTFPPIGKPIANTQIYILDKNLKPLPIGVPGEIFISGIGLGKGYLRRKNLTAKYFISPPNRLQFCPTKKLYKSGDLARWLPCGNIEFLGRIDKDQIKINGHRIELNEICELLNKHPDIIQSAVLSHKHNSKNLLSAYIVLKKTGQLSSEKIKAYLAEVLPKHMLPETFIFMDKLPLTTSGKLDKQALPKPSFNARNPNTLHKLPSTTLEKTLMLLFSEVLPRKPTTINDNFFALGGNSLLAMQLALKLNKQFKINLDINATFEHPTIKELSDVIRKNNNFISKLNKNTDLIEYL